MIFTHLDARVRLTSLIHSLKRTMEEEARKATATFLVEKIVNDKQLEAITKPLNANVQVVAGPGTGELKLERLG